MDFKQYLLNWIKEEQTAEDKWKALAESGVLKTMYNIEATTYSKEEAKHKEKLIALLKLLDYWMNPEKQQELSKLEQLITNTRLKNVVQGI